MTVGVHEVGAYLTLRTARTSALRSLVLLAPQSALMSRVMSNFGGISVDPLTLVLCLTPSTFLALLPINVLMWDARTPQRAVRR